MVEGDDHADDQDQQDDRLAAGLAGIPAVDLGTEADLAPDLGAGLEGAHAAQVRSAPVAEWAHRLIVATGPLVGREALQLDGPVLTVEGVVVVGLQVGSLDALVATLAAGEVRGAAERDLVRRRIV